MLFFVLILMYLLYSDLLQNNKLMFTMKICICSKLYHVLNSCGSQSATILFVLHCSIVFIIDLGTLKIN